MKVLVTGCTGYVGRHLVRRLLQEKHQIRALVRKTSDAVTLQELGIETLIGDVTQPSTLVGITEGIDAVFHLAGVFLGSDYKAVVVGGTGNLINVFADSEIKSFVFTSFSLVYGPTKSVLLKEDDPCHPNFKEAEYRLEAEQLLLKAYRDHAFPAVILRIPSIYGGSQSHFESIFINRIRNGRMFVFGRGKNRSSYVHVDDVTQALILAATTPSAVGDVFNIAGGDVVAMNQLCGSIARKVGAKMPSHIPIWAAYTLSSFSGFFAHLRGEEPPLPVSLIKILTMNGGLDIAKAKRILGYEPIFDNTIEGIQQSYFEGNR